MSMSRLADGEDDEIDDEKPSRTLHKLNEALYNSLNASVRMRERLYSKFKYSIYKQTL